MAVVRQRLGRGPYDFAQKMCNSNVLKSQIKQWKSAIQASSLSTGILLGDSKNGGSCGTENRVTARVSPDSYTRVTPLFGADNNLWGDGNVAENYYHGRNKDCTPLNKALAGNIERRYHRHRSYAKFRETFCNCRSARCLFWGHGQFVFIRSYSGNGSEPLYKTKTGYYEILEVTPTATQAQIKTAYYKQSFIYHPDRNAGSDEATTRFSEISEAYTVLGNKALRKKYDRGLLSQSDLVATARPSAKDTTGSSARQQADKQRSVMGADTRGGIYDFDKFFKAHYNEQLQRERSIRSRKEEMLKKKQETIAEKTSDKMVELGLVMMLVMAVAILMSLKKN